MRNSLAHKTLLNTLDRGIALQTAGINRTALSYNVLKLLKKSLLTSKSFRELSTKALTNFLKVTRVKITLHVAQKSEAAIDIRFLRVLLLTSPLNTLISLLTGLNSKSEFSKMRSLISWQTKNPSRGTSEILRNLRKLATTTSTYLSSNPSLEPDFLATKWNLIYNATSVSFKCPRNYAHAVDP
jgi:hypothetical protein